MAVHYRTKGFVLKKEDLREADQVFTIFTKDFGKLRILGKAIRKIKSKLRAGIELFYLSEIEFIQGKTYKTLTDAIAIEKFKDIRQDLEKLKIANQIAGVADSLIKGEEKDEAIWDLLSEVFPKLNKEATTVGAKLPAGSLAPTEMVEQKCISLAPTGEGLLYYYFLWNLLSILGYQIDLYHCPKCQRSLAPGKLYFNPEEGGIVCCEEGQQISPDIVKILRLFLKQDWNILSRLKIEEKHKKELEEISDKELSSYEGA